MTALREKLIETDFVDRVFTDGDLNNLLDNSAASRYGLVNKALKKDELIRIRRGLYLLSDKYRRKKISKYFLASRIVPHSYVSLESALAYHGWIPEHVQTVTSVLALGRAKKFMTPFGEFIYNQLSVNEYEFLTGVMRVEEIEREPFFIALPLRALADFVYVKRIDWDGLNYLTSSLRIDKEQLLQIESDFFDQIEMIYQSRRVLHFFSCLRRELKK